MERMKRRRRMAWVLALALTVQLIPLPQGALAGLSGWIGQSIQAASSATSGTDGNISWSLTRETPGSDWQLGSSETAYKLTISGSGEMPSYSMETYKDAGGTTRSRTTAPWKEYIDHIQTINIRSGITGISGYAFYQATALSSVTMPNTVKTIGALSFSGCANLKTVDRALGITKIGSNAFYGCTDLKSVVLTKSTTELGNYAFAYCSSLTSVEIPYSITEIPSRAFYACKNVTTVTIAEGVQKIGSAAFSGCVSLTDLRFPTNSLTMLSEDAFTDTALTALTIPASVKTVSGNPCKGGELKELHVASGNQNYVEKDGLLIEKENGVMKRVVAYPCKGEKKVTVPSPVEEIGTAAFYATNVQTVNFPASLTLINAEAFMHSDLQSLKIPGNVTVIGREAFSYCGQIKSVEFGAGLLEIRAYAFNKCSQIRELSLPDKITTIGNSAFNYCQGLKEVTLPNSITSIGSSVFSNCSSLQQVEFGDKIQTINGTVFAACPKLDTVTISPGNPYMLAEDDVIYSQDKTTLIYYAAGKTEDKLLIPDTVQTIGAMAFSTCSYLAELRIPASVQKMETRSVYANTKLGKILFYGNAPQVDTENSKYTTKKETVTYYEQGNGAIVNNFTRQDNSDLLLFKTEASTGWGTGWTSTARVNTDTVQYTWNPKYTIQTWDPDKTDTADGSFAGLIWHYRDDIGEVSFAGSGKVPDYTEDTVPMWSNDSSVDHRQDVRLVDTTQAESVEIGAYAFYQAGSLIRLYAGEELKRVGDYAFADCGRLAHLFAQDVPVIGKAAFAGDCALPDEVDVRGAKQIGDRAFEGATGVQDVLLGDGLTQLGTAVFRNCEKLSGVILPDRLTQINEETFRGCSALRTINIPSAVTSIGALSFAKCSSLHKVYFYGNLPETLAENAFTDCHADLTLYHRTGNASWETGAPDGSWHGIPVKAQDRFYTERKDGYSFSNSAGSFGYGTKYFIPRQRYITAVQDILLGSYYYATDFGWKGSCFGMASSTMEFYEGKKFSVEEYDPSAKSLYDLKAPGSASAALTKIIEIYQVSQYAQEISDEMADHKNKYRQMVKKVEEFERSGGMKVDEEADPIVLCVYDKYSGHAVIPVSVTVDAKGNYQMQVYDCNYPTAFRTLTIRKDFSGITYGRYTDASFVSYKTIQNALKNADFTGSGLKNYNKENNKVAVAVNQENVTIENGGGKDYQQIKGAYEQRAVSDGTQEGFSGVKRFILPQGEYTVAADTAKTAKTAAATSAALTYYVATEDMYTRVETDDADAELTVKSVEGKGYDEVSLQTEEKNTRTSLVLMNEEGLTRKITVEGGSVTAQITPEDTISLSVEQKDSSVKIDGEQVDVKDALEVDFPTEQTPEKTTYTVMHWQSKPGADTEIHDTVNYTLAEVEQVEADAGETAVPATKEYKGFNSPSIQKVVVEEDGSTVINYYYSRQKFLQTVQARYEQADGSYSAYRNIEIQEAEYGSAFHYQVEETELHEAAAVEKYTVDSAKINRLSIPRRSYRITVTGGTGIRSVTGSGIYKVGQTCTIGAIVADGYVWSGWDDGNIMLERIVTMGTKDQTYQASAVKKAPEVLPTPTVAATTPGISQPTDTTVPSPDATATPSMTPESSAMPSQTPQPSAPPVPGLSPEPSVTPTPEPTQMPTPAPGESPQPTKPSVPSPKPTDAAQSAAPSELPVPSASNVPSAAPTDVAQSAAPSGSPVPNNSAVPGMEPSRSPVQLTVQPGLQSSPAVKATKAPAATARPATKTKLKKGSKVTSGKYTYLITGTSAKGGTVSLAGSKKKLTEVKIPVQIRVQGKKYKVTGIAANAFKNNKKMEFVLLSEQIRSIGKNAFAGCSKLKAVVMKTSRLDTVGRNAFRGTGKDVTVKTPKEKWNAYAKLCMNQGGMSSTAVFIIDPVKLKYKGKSY